MEETSIDNETTKHKDKSLHLVLEETLIDKNIQLHSMPVESMAHALKQVVTEEEEPEPTIPAQEQPALKNVMTTHEDTPVNLELVLEEMIIEIRGNQKYKSYSVCHKMLIKKSMKGHVRRVHKVGLPTKRKEGQDFAARMIYLARSLGL